MHFGAVPQPAAHLSPGMYELFEDTMCRRRANGTQAWSWSEGILAPPLPPRVSACK
jgi:para-nitrobenzyl esterase